MPDHDELFTLAPARPGELAFHVFVPATARAAGFAPLLVAVHGISRNAHEQATSFASVAAARGHVVVAPCFDTPEDADYQRLGRRGRGRRSDLALDQALVRLSEQTGIRFGQRFLFGFSGGGQFVHRYAMAHPERVDGVVVAAAGWYTFPDPDLAYPMGLRVDASLAGVRLDPAEFLRVHTLVVVGSLDRDRDDSIRKSEKLDRRQGVDRLERAHRWAEAMVDASRKRCLDARHEILELPDVGHSFADCVAAGLVKETFAFLDSIEPRRSFVEFPIKENA